jgi:predicted ATPase
LDVPARERTPAHLVAQLARRSLLLVLDNLEQLSGADEVVEQLLGATQDVTVVATSRQALGLPAERRVPVAPLGLPQDATFDAAETSDAVQLFVQRARSVQPSFRLTPENVRDVVAVCRRLDGLPLAVELCAARIRVLAPGALLARLDDRLDNPLDIPSTSRLVTARQRTLRDTISWSYELLSAPQQAFFRRLSLLAGGGDLDAVVAVTPGGDREAHGAGPVADRLTTVAELVDASLTNASEGPDGEPRIVLLETIRSFAWDQLVAAGELEVAQAAHAEHYTLLAARLRGLRETRHLAALGLAEADLENFREALEWCVPSEDRPGSGDSATGLRLCAALGWVWWMGGYVAEGRDWHERVIARAAGTTSSELATCLGGLANLLLSQGDPRLAHDMAGRSLAMARSLDDAATEAFALGVLGTAEQNLGRLEEARGTLREALGVHRRRSDQRGLARVLGNLAGLEESLGNLSDAESLLRESLEMHDRLGDVHDATIQRQNLANLLAVAGRVEEADTLARGLIGTILDLRNPSLTMAFANTYINILVRRNDPVRAALLFGAEEEMHRRLDIPNPYQDEELEDALALVADTMSADVWDQHRKLGRDMRVEDLLTELSADRGRGQIGANGGRPSPAPH